jgi:[ribosomal protein S18]-alanine N-acetyltransferase
MTTESQQTHQAHTLSIEPMRGSDLAAVMTMDKICFPSPWSADSYVTELGNRAAQYFVARTPDSLVGYGGVWVINHDSHITTLAVLPQYRRHGIGEALLVALLNEAILRQAHRISLEVRVGNIGARNLYQKYGFVESERRQNYYLDNGEDALILRVDNVHLPSYRQMLPDAGAMLHRTYGTDPHTQ